VTAWGLIGRRRAGKRLKKHAPIRPTALTRCMIGLPAGPVYHSLDLPG
jgi:hypothetical protein